MCIWFFDLSYNVFVSLSKSRLQFRTKQTRQADESVHKLISVFSIVYRGKVVMQPLLFEHTAPPWKQSDVNQTPVLC